jgi:hypothetical protein
LAPPQRELSVAEHSPHAPALGPVVWHTGRAGSVQLGAPSPAQGTHRRVVGEQRGEAPPQSALLMQPTQTPTPDVTSHRGWAPPQAVWLAFEHCPQAPLAWQTPVAAGHWASLLHVVQLPLLASQTGRSPGQVDEVKHSTQRAAAASHNVRGDAQAAVFPGAHWPQPPPGRQTGADPEQSATAAQPRQIRVTPSQTGVAPVQSAAATQPTQMPPATSHSDCAPAQADRLLAEH